MSTGLSDQRMKGQGNQVANGPKEHVSEHEDYDSWRSQHQGYAAPLSTTMSSEPYLPNYYGTSFPYQAFGVNEGTWSNSEPVTFLGSYGGQIGHESFGMEGMFGGGFSGAGAAGYNYFHGNGDYSTWGPNSTPLPNPAAMPARKHYDDHYYRHHENPYPGESVKGLELGVQSLGFCDKGTDSKEVMKEGGPPAKTWASIASQPAKPQPPLGSHQIKKKGPGMPPPPVVPGKHNLDIGTWDNKNGAIKSGGSGGVVASGGTGVGRGAGWGNNSSSSVRSGNNVPTSGPPPGAAPTAGYRPVPIVSSPAMQPPCRQPMHPPLPPSTQHQHHSLHSPTQVATVIQQVPSKPVIHQDVLQQQQSHPVLKELKLKNNYNPTEFNLSCESARFFVIKSYSEDDVHRSIKYEIWCSTEYGNKRLDSAFRERETVPNGAVYLFFSVNGSGHFCGVARMMSPVDYNSSSSVWAQDMWKGQFKVRWIYVKDVPNVQLRHIKLENNENKPVTNSRDTQEVPLERGKEVLQIIHSYKQTTSIFDDFVHYERLQEEEDTKKQAVSEHSSDQHSNVPHKEREGGRTRGVGGSRGGVSRHH